MSRDRSENNWRVYNNIPDLKHAPQLYQCQERVNEIASRFQEEDQPKELRYKLRNGFCRFFELGHLVANQVDSILSVE